MKKLSPITVKIKNFQSIEDVELNIVGFTCITGKTNIGKSAIIRAISKSLLNDPVVGLVRHGKSHSTVDISSESWSFKWEKGEKGINRYEIGSRLLDKTGQKQIDEIKNFGFTSIKISDSEIQPWLASQFEPIFLLNKSGPQITDFISSVSGLNVLQDAVVLASRGRKRATEEAKMKNGEAEKAKEKLTKFVGIEILQKQVNDLKEQRRCAGELKSKIDEAVTTKNEILILKEEILELRSVCSTNIPNILDRDRIKKYSDAQITLQEMKSLAISIISLKSLLSTNVPFISKEIKERVSDYKELSEAISLARDVSRLEKITSIEIDFSIDDIVNETNRFKIIEETNIEAKNIAKEIIKLSNLPQIPEIELKKQDILDLKSSTSIYQELRNIRKDCIEIEKEILAINKTKKEIEDKIKSIPVCPTCGQVVQTSNGHSHKAQISL